MVFDNSAPRTNDIVQAQALDVSDADNDPVTIQFDFYVNNELKQSVMTTGTTADFDLGVGGQGDKGDVISVTATPWDGLDWGNSVSDQTTITNSAPIVFGNFIPLDVLRNNLTDPIDLYQYGWDADGDDLQFTITSNPTNGDLYSLGGAYWDYISDPSYVGTDGFSFSASDGDSNCNTASFALAVTNEAPTASDTGSYYVLKNQTITISDLNTYGDSASTSALTPSIVTNPSNGTLVDLGNGAYEYHPDADFVGSDSFTYTLNDGVDDSGAATVTLLVVDQPLVVNDARVPICGLDPVTISASDLIAKVQSALPSPTFTVTSVSAADLGQLVDNQDGTWTYTPPANLAGAPKGADKFAFSISDSVNTASANFTLLVPYNQRHDPGVQRAEHMQGRTALFPFTLAQFIAPNEEDKIVANIRLASSVQQGITAGDSECAATVVASLRVLGFAWLNTRFEERRNAGGQLIGYSVLFDHEDQGGGITLDTVVMVGIPTAADFRRYGCTTDGSLWYTLHEMAYVQRYRRPQDGAATFTTMGGYYQPVASRENSLAVMRHVLGVTVGNSWNLDTQLQQGALAAQLNTYLVQAMTAATRPTFTVDQHATASNYNGITAGSSYAVIGLDSDNRVMLWNPRQAPADPDPLIRVSLDDFRALFSSLITHVAP